MSESKELHILWTNDNPTTAQLMVMTYATNCMTSRLWERITVILWGATVKLAAENGQIQEQIKVAKHVGVKFSACANCARQLGVTDDLKALDIEVAPWVEPFTQLVQSREPIVYV